MKTTSTRYALNSVTILTTLLVSQFAWAEAPGGPASESPAPESPLPSAESATAAPSAPAPENAPTVPSTAAGVEPSAPATATTPATVTPPVAPAAAAPPAAASADLKPAPVPPPYMKRYVPEANSWELGLFGGVMFPSSDHQLFDPNLPSSVAQPFKSAGVVGARVAYFPLTFVGVEAEGAGMPSELADGSPAGLWAVRGHVIAQLPGHSLTPFALFGAGALGASSNAMGNDTDDAIHFGVGAKLALDDHLSVRADLRDSVTRRRGGSAGEGAHHPEVIFGITFTPTRRKPDHDGDTVLDAYDQCPTVPGLVEHAGCQAPDGDADGVPDSADECPEATGVGPNGCPVIVCPADVDGDGVVDQVDRCPGVAGSPDGAGCPVPAPNAIEVTGPSPELPSEERKDAPAEAGETVPESTQAPSIAPAQ